VAGSPIRPSRGRSLWLPLIGLLISAVLLALLMRRVDPVATWQRLRALSPAWFVPAVVAGLWSLAARSWRWRLIFPAAARPGFWASFRGLGLGNLLNLVLPARAGDVARCLLSRRAHPESHPGTALGALVLEKVLDGLAALAVLGAAVCVLDPPAWFRGLGLVAAAVFIGALAGLAVLQRWPWQVLGGLRRVARRVGHDAGGERLARVAGRFLLGLEALSSPGRTIALAGLTVGVWVAEAVAVACLAAALGVPLGPGGAVVTTSVIALATMIPSAPGFLGTYEFFSVASLGLFGVDPSPALALTVVMHAQAYVMISAVGLASWAVEAWWWHAAVLPAASEDPLSVREAVSGAPDVTAIGG
jgi:uncharacterized protein (TIRG00374 family)